MRKKDITKQKKKRGAPKGNQNARTHGFYSHVLDRAQKARLKWAREVDGIDEEIAIMRVKLLTLVDDYPDRVDLQMSAANTIARLLRTRHIISGGRKHSIEDAIRKVNTELAIPLGVKLHF
jgi:hypothetical protein